MTLSLSQLRAAVTGTVTDDVNGQAVSGACVTAYNASTELPIKPRAAPI